ncbi:hypothetical protein [Chromatium okenii]|uniref:hypothetical protein n=1 Tax=Chromatium okenii TaxID=61644 RepID=UPI0011AFFCF2|nr:hypothetical protein [Chromatium okenii]
MSEIAKTTQCSINAVSQKLKQGLDKKLQSGGQQDAIKLLEEAYQCARPPSQLPPPWPQITAYRLAHLLMRSGCKTDWHKIDCLLEEASSGNSILGAMPLIYRLVSLQKCHAPPEKLEDVYESAVKKLNQQLPVLDKPKRDEGHLIQLNAVNLLEMAAYFIGLKYKTLEGQIELGNDFFANLGVGKSAWFVLDSQQEGSSIAYPESMARQIFTEQRGTGNCLAIEYNGDAYLPDRYIKNAFTEQQICDWYLRLKNVSLQSRRDKNKRCIVDPERTEEAERMSKKRFRDCLIKKLGLAVDQVNFDAWWKNDGSSNTVKSPIDKPVIMLINPMVFKKSPLSPIE